MKLSIIILAAGEGKRMCSSLPKVLHKIAGQSLLERVITTAYALSHADLYVICGHGKDQVINSLSHLPVHWVTQSQQLGTGHAVAQAMPLLEDEGMALVLYGDVPLISLNTLQSLINNTPPNGIGLLVADVEDPTGLGRIVLNSNGQIRGIVEEKDATDQEKMITEIFTGILTAPVAQLKRWLALLDNNNAQNEYYLPGIVPLALAEGAKITKTTTLFLEEVQGVNDKRQLAELERVYQKKYAEKLMKQGVYLSDPSRLDIRGEVSVGIDVSIDINVILEGKVTIGNATCLKSNNIIKNSIIGNNVVIKENCVIEDAVIEDNAIIGPFAHLRPGTHLSKKAHIGNFVEIKKSVVGPGSKVNHLSYIGDCEIGKDVNVGAGTITCNYDGVNKHKTVIEDNCFIGSGTQLVAPVRIKEGGTIGAGSTITHDTNPKELTISRVKQQAVKNWQRPKKKETNQCVES